MLRKMKSFFEGVSESLSLYNQIPMPKDRLKYIYDLSYDQIARGWNIVYRSLKDE